MDEVPSPVRGRALSSGQRRQGRRREGKEGLRIRIPTPWSKQWAPGGTTY